MAIPVVCSNCSLRLSYMDDRAGTTTACPNCDRPIPVPGLPDEVAAISEPEPLPAIQLQAEAPPERGMWDLVKHVASESKATLKSWQENRKNQPSKSPPASPKTEPNEDFSRQEPKIRPLNFAESFVWWASRYPSKHFPFVCPSCCSEIGLRQRVTISRRSCPGCGFKIDTQAIDDHLLAIEHEKQWHEKESRAAVEEFERRRRDDHASTMAFKPGCLVVIAFIVILASMR